MQVKIFHPTGKRSSYNRLLKHMIVTTTIVDRFENGENLANILNEMIDTGTIQAEQIPAILNIILVSRSALPFRSVNLSETVTSYNLLIEKTSQWTDLDLVLAYYHPTFGIILVNPAKSEHWLKVHELKRDELLVVYCRSKSGGNDIARKGLDAFFSILAGKAAVEDASFVAKATSTPQVAAKVVPVAQAAPTAPPPPTHGAKMTPKYSVQVSNELFHNGNVEAWKNIIEAYHARYVGCRVIVYHEGELIQDLNSLFKWGKVK
ncbi:MAG: hypothetical protein H3C43_12340, partial [Leptonema sp. (in: Bacteria)]|nr:hypothetical protein [Leptonema sp. (in: bacteria)]